MQFLNQSLGFFNKGHFEPIDRNFIAESYQALKPIKKIKINTINMTTIHF
ncbi:hypothetical protein JP0037_00670 [Helicobacter pylori]|nr:hypothetical protein [Helicobacter pylori]EJB26118.1 hypothetical protein HPCPY6271_0635 [Helicobacter pylori CPY6271]GHP20336.1 hypothetical protein JP0037_00670 [Helicobacter pylori]GHS40865.1 hypothetical protein JP0123_03300 [Helicobacter pylori]